MKTLPAQNPVNGSILSDLEVFLQFIEERNLEVTGSKGLLPNHTISALNLLMTHPLSLKLKREQQLSYPHISALYLLSRSTGLLQIKANKSKRHLAINETVRNAWKELNDTEKYFNLMQTWFFYSNDKLITRVRYSCDDVLENILNFMKKLKKPLLFKSPLDQKYELYVIKTHNVALLEMFGLIKIIDNKNVHEPSWSISKITSTELGNQISSLLNSDENASEEVLFQKMIEKYNNLFDKEKQADNFFQQLRPFFPNWDVCIKPTKKITDHGGYFLKVSLSNTLWRRIKIQGTEFLETLAVTILDAFNFDYDHLYEFSYINSFGMPQTIVDPGCEGNLYADEIRVGDLDILPGDLIEFHYDFGDDWKFKVQIEKIDPELKIKKPTVIEKEGRAPKQYSYY